MKKEEKNSVKVQIRRKKNKQKLKKNKEKLNTQIYRK